MLKQIHTMAELDFDQLMEIYIEGCEENGQEFWPELPYEEQVARSKEHYHNYLQEQFFKKTNAVYTVWEIDGRYVSALRLEPQRDGLLMEALETRPDARCQGHASALIQAVQKWLSEQGPVKIYSHVSKKNTASLKTHQRCGFERFLDYMVRFDGSVSENFYTMKYDEM